MDRVLENLIGNALRHTTENGRITIEVEKAGSQLLVRVSDTGCGIPPERLSRMFDPIPGRFGDPGKDGEGAGLGLVIARRILELHGSDITVQSVVDEGSTFQSHLPGTDYARPAP